MSTPLIQFLGTGNAFNADGRGTQSILVAPGSASPFLVDCGPTAVHAMVRFDVDWKKIDRLFLTHLHGDHTAGWPFLLLNLVMEDRRTRPFEIYGPLGSKACLEGLVRNCFSEITERLSFDLRFHEFPVALRTGLDAGQGMLMDVLPMQHHASSISYRFEIDGSFVGFSGDTAWCENLERLASGCDILITECSTVEKELSGHLSLEEIRADRAKLGKAQLVLVHLTDSVAEDLARDPVPNLLAAYDGMIFLG